MWTVAFVDQRRETCLGAARPIRLVRSWRSMVLAVMNVGLGLTVEIV